VARYLLTLVLIIASTANAHAQKKHDYIDCHALYPDLFENDDRTGYPQSLKGTDSKSVREWYVAVTSVEKVKKLNDEWSAKGISLYLRAERTWCIRFDARKRARDFMENRDEVERLRERDFKKYGLPEGPSFEDLVQQHMRNGLTEADAYLEIIASATRKDPETNKKYGIEKVPEE
jgi:hypothetical protein